MVDNYSDSSSKICIDLDSLQKAKAESIVDREVKALEESEEGYCGVAVDVEDDGIWIHSDENINVEHVEIIARALIEELEIDKPFYCSWNYSCSKPVVDEFGGGCFVIVRGKPTHWVDALTECQRWVKEERIRDSNTCSKCGADLTVMNSVRREYISKSEDGNSVFGQGHYDTNGDYDPDTSISFGNRSFDLCDDSDTCAACGGQP